MEKIDAIIHPLLDNATSNGYLDFTLGDATIVALDLMELHVEAEDMSLTEVQPSVLRWQQTHKTGPIV